LNSGDGWAGGGWSGRRRVAASRGRRWRPAGLGIWVSGLGWGSITGGYRGMAGGGGKPGGGSGLWAETGGINIEIRTGRDFSIRFHP